MTAPTITGTAASGSRSGNGAITVTPPAPTGTKAWLGLVLNNADAPATTPATGFTLVTTVAMSAPIGVYLATANPGASWTIGGTGTSLGGVVIVIPLDQAISLDHAAAVATNSLISPANGTAAKDSLVFRMIAGARADDLALGYPAAATLGRTYKAAPIGAYVFEQVAATQVTAGSAIASATFTNPSGTIYGSDSATFTLAGTAATPETHSGSAAITSTAATVTAGSKKAAGTAALATASQIATAGTKRGTGTSGLLAQATIAADGSKSSHGTAGITSTTTVAAAGVGEHPGSGSGTADLGSTTTLATAGTKTAAGTATLTTAAVIAAAGRAVTSGRDLKILGTTVPTLGWAASGLEPRWPTTTPKLAPIDVTGPASNWATTTPEL